MSESSPQRCIEHEGGSTRPPSTETTCGVDTIPHDDHAVSQQIQCLIGDMDGGLEAMQENLGKLIDEIGKKLDDLKQSIGDGTQTIPDIGERNC
mmetsp:Transcript_606/g.1205  ORF Transcript_606/g.1205 Transcript_606/m.1205 type:complete len:94 (+) Transcript_606:119-400(+)|eukprot:CAMPEP_0184683144 /NCGR_PEP_ID=MMETSP0312-20130426/10011_1 /TAXON_ID=31354 /ORGANISM="Compsopogon coeruleus, Strain SAG 36.94" /LENGTH=93 /DNA_ID=CAMNT_0027135241 /DNA_START=42 /DNA_END=323 /DNA_ORIENTATION=+